MKLLILIFCILFCQISISQSIEKSRDKHLKNLLDTTTRLLNREDLKTFISTDYFKVDSSYRVKASFKISKGPKFKMPTSTERMQVYRRYAYVTFYLQGEPITLSVYQNMELRKKAGYEDYLFLPIKDLSSSKTTYGGGRYLDIRIPKKDNIELDFNLLYNPYCAYSHRYSCPIPPKENTLSISIDAGEKTPILKENH